MGIPVDFYVLFGYTFEADSISFGDGQTIDVPVNGGTSGQLDIVQLVKRQITLSLKGATESDVIALEATRSNNVLDLLNRSITTQDINVGGFIVEAAYITKITPSGPKIVNGITIFDSVEILATSRNYS